MAMSASVQDSLPFILESLDKDVLMSLGHQLLETVPLCTYDEVNCVMKKSVKSLVQMRKKMVNQISGLTKSSS